MRLFEDDADLLFFASELADKKKTFSKIDGSGEPDQRAAGVEQDRGGVLVEGTQGFAPAINDNRDAEGFAVA